MIQQEAVKVMMPDGREVTVLSPRTDMDIYDGRRWTDVDNADPIGTLLMAVRLGGERYGFRFVNAVFPLATLNLMFACKSVRDSVAVHVYAGHIQPPVDMGAMMESLPMWLGIPRSGLTINPDGGKAVWLYTSPNADGVIESAVVRYS